MDETSEKTKELESHQLSIEDIQKIAIQNIINHSKGLDDAIHVLRRWWCQYYKRPYKDPLFDEYTLEEIFLEYYEVSYYNDDKKRTEAANKYIFNDDEDEEWLKKQFGDQYQSQDEMIKRIEEAAKAKRLKDEAEKINKGK